MTGRRPARVLAPLALVACAVALFTVVSSGGGDEATDGSGGTPSATATATPTAAKKRATATQSRTYTVKPGDTPSGIADANGVSVDDLLAANPDVDPRALSPGQKLKLPAK